MQTSLSSPSTASSSTLTSPPQKWDSDSFPIYAELISLVRTLDVLKVSHINLYLIITGVAYGSCASEVNPRNYCVTVNRKSLTILLITCD
jgi:hypothetical protein